MLQISINWLIYDLLNFSKTSLLVKSFNFFIYDTIKILFLLIFMITLIGILRTYIPPYKIREWIVNKHPFIRHLSAALFGAFTPFCSCSSIPLFLSFIQTNVPLGVALTFLITSPILNEYLFVLMIGAFGLKIALLYAASGISIGIISGMILGKMNLEQYLEQDIAATSSLEEDYYPTFKSRITFGLNEALSVTKKIWKWVVVGVAIGALIHNYVPQETIQTLIDLGGPFTVTIATILGVPIYGSCAAIVPIAVVLFNKGVSLGTALAFMMAVAAISLPEAIILRRAMNIRLIGIYFGVVAIAIIVTGYLFNFLVIFI